MAKLVVDDDGASCPCTPDYVREFMALNQQCADNDQALPCAVCFDRGRIVHHPVDEKKHMKLHLSRVCKHTRQSIHIISVFLCDPCRKRMLTAMCLSDGHWLRVRNAFPGTRFIATMLPFAKERYFSDPEYRRETYVKACLDQTFIFDE